MPSGPPYNKGLDKKDLICYDRSQLKMEVKHETESRRLHCVIEG